MPNIMNYVDTFSSALETSKTLSAKRLPYKEYVIVQKPNECYDLIHTATDTVVCEDLYLFSAVLALAIALDAQDIEGSKNILYLENEYMRLYNNMMAYRNAKNIDLYNNEKIEAEHIVKMIQRYVKQTLSCQER